MTVFVCHSSKDDSAIRELVKDLELARQPVWLDQELRGGDPWWQDILQQIRGCQVFLFALSRNSLASKPCRAELGYARALGLPILPVQIGPVDNIRIAPISDVQVVDLRECTTAGAISLMAAVHDLSAQHRELPDPLPEPPPVPFEYLLRLGSAIEAAQLSPAEQADLIRQLRDCVETEDDDGVRDDALELLRALRRRPDVTYRNAAEIDAMLDGRTAEGRGRMSGEGAGRADAPSADPGGDTDPTGSSRAFPQSDRASPEGEPAQGGQYLYGDQPRQDPGGGGPGPPPGPAGGPGPDESGSRPGGSNTRNLLIAGMAALVLAVAVVLVASRGGGNGPTAPVATSTPETSTSVSTSSSPSSDSTSASSSTRSYGTFLSTLPPDLTGCVESGLAGDGDVAAATCGPSSTQPGPQMAVFHRYPNRASLDAVFASDLRTAGLRPLQPPQDCSSSPGEFHWYSGGLEGGDVACAIGGGQIEIAWTDYAFLNEGVVATPGTTQAQLTALYQWWSQNYRG